MLTQFSLHHIQHPSSSGTELTALRPSLRHITATLHDPLSIIAQHQKTHKSTHNTNCDLGGAGGGAFGTRKNAAPTWRVIRNFTTYHLIVVGVVLASLV